MSKQLRPIALLLLVAVVTACTDQPVDPGVVAPDTTPAPIPMGVYAFTLTGVDGSDPDAARASRAEQVILGGVSASLSATAAGLGFEVLSSSSVTEGVRGQGGHRYVSVTYRVRNKTGAPVSNLTFVPTIQNGTIGNTPFTALLRFNGSPATTSLAPQFVPTGAVFIQGGEMLAPTPDVLQVFDESEVAAVTLPPGISSLFPYGFVVRNASDPNSRTIPVAANDNDWGGLLTFAFRYPLQPGGASDDPFSIGFQAMAVQDSEVRLTESIEEGQDTAAVRRLRERATALGATTVTVLNGSGRMSPAVSDYPGQRQLCSIRTAGAPGSAETRINAPAAYTGILLLRPGESLSSCEADFRTGTAARPATNVWFSVKANAVDRYGNLMTSAVDTVKLTSNSGPPVNIAPGGGSALASGVANLSVQYADYGMSQLQGTGRRMRGWQTIQVAGVTRNWTAGAGTTDWHTGGNWQFGAAPMYLDSVFIPAAAPLYPALAANVSVQGVTVENGATIALGAFNLTAGGDVATGTSGGITNTVGSLYLAGVAKTVQGVLPRVRVTGTYSLTGNVTARAPLRVELGRLRNERFRVRAVSY